MASTVSIRTPNLVVFGVILDMIKRVICIVETNETSICGKEIKGQYPTNLKKHLRNMS